MAKKLKISWIILTHNRKNVVKKSLEHNFSNTTRIKDLIHEFIWVDNGSTDGLVEYFIQNIKVDIAILNKENKGVSKGYNQALALATGDWVLIIGGDMLMPDNWLETLENYLNKIENTGVACIFSETSPKIERVISPVRCQNGLDLIETLPMGSRIINRKFMVEKVGFLREDFGLYGWDDVEWARRWIRVSHEEDFLCYTILGHTAKHLEYDETTTEYLEFKKKEVNSAKKHRLMTDLRLKNFPYYNPYQKIYD